MALASVVFLVLWLVVTAALHLALSLSLVMSAAMALVVATIGGVISYKIATYDPHTIDLFCMNPTATPNADVARAVRKKPGALHLKLATYDEVDLSPVSSLTSLRTVELRHLGFLSDKPFSLDLSPLQGLRDLAVLKIIQSDALRDVSPIASLSGLQELDLSFCHRIGEIGAVSRLEGLRVLNLAYSSVRDISPVAGLVDLSVLHLAHADVTDLAPLETLGNLEELSLPQPTTEHALQMQIRDAVRRHPKLRKLSLKCSWTPQGERRIHWAPDLTPLVALRGLTELKLEGCSQTTKFVPLLLLEDLRVLDLESTRFLIDIETLSQMKGLRILRLAQAWGIAMPERLAMLTQLDELNLHLCEGISEHFVVELRKALPHCAIHYVAPVGSRN